MEENNQNIRRKYPGIVVTPVIIADESRMLSCIHYLIDDYLQYVLNIEDNRMYILNINNPNGGYTDFNEVKTILERHIF
jgi:hypothetical protein